MASYPHFVQLAWDITNQLLRDWQDTPHRWEREIDIQSELQGRLSFLFQLIGKATVADNHSRNVARVIAEPTVYYKDLNETDCRCNPDIVIRDNASNNPPKDGTFFQWSMIWACELKYDPYDWSDSDVAKLRLLLDQQVITFGCWIRLSRKLASEGDGITWRRDSENDRLWTCEARLLDNTQT